MASIECGAEAAKHFALAQGYRNLNHGSYGTYPKEIDRVYQDFHDKTEARPDAFIRYQYRSGAKLLEHSREAIANYLSAPVETCVYVLNATAAVETVLRNLVCEPGDVVVVFNSVYPAFANTLYPAFANTLAYLSETTPLKYKTISYLQPVSDDAICDAFEATVKDIKAAGNNPRMAIFDTINASPGVRMPFERLVKLCRNHGVMSCVDRAHGVGHIPLDLSVLDPDFFTSNCHKWLYVPRSCAVLYVPARNQHLLRTTLPTSFFYGQGFPTNFSNVGTLNDNPCLCVPAALQWRQRLTWAGKRGEEAAMGYMRHLARCGGSRAAEILHTRVLENAEGTLGECNFANVLLPLDAGALVGDDPVQADTIKEWIMRAMVLDHDTSALIVFYAGAWWARLGAQVYLTLDDFESAGRSLLEVCARAERGEWKEE